VVETYRNREIIEKYSHIASFDEIKENDFNLNIPRYVDTFEEEDAVDMVSIGTSIHGIRKEKAVLESSMYEMIASLQYSQEDEEWIKGALEVFKIEN
ncbi:MAG: N-6 DNA methylase, partial [Planococcus donghaensis]